MDKFINLLKKQNSNKGMTLVEVLVAITILLILVIAFTNLIGWNFTNIFIMGEKSKAIAKAMEKIDQLKAIVGNAVDSDGAIAAMQNTDIGWVESEDLLDETTKECVFYFETKNEEVNGTMVNGCEVTVVVYYQDYKFHIKLDSFILLPIDI